MFSSIADALGGFFGSGAPGMAAQGGGQGGFMQGLQRLFGKGGQPSPGLPGAPPMPGVQMGGQNVAIPQQAWGFGNEAGAMHQAVQPQMQGMMPPQVPGQTRMSPEMMMALGQAMQGGGQQQPRMAAPGGWANQGGHNPQSMNLHNMMQMAQPLSDPYQRMQQRSLAQARLGMGRQ